MREACRKGMAKRKTLRSDVRMWGFLLFSGGFSFGRRLFLRPFDQRLSDCSAIGQGKRKLPPSEDSGVSRGFRGKNAEKRCVVSAPSS